MSSPVSAGYSEHVMRVDLLGEKAVTRDHEFLDGFGRPDAARGGAVVEHDIAVRYHARLARLVGIPDRLVYVAIDVRKRERSSLVQYTPGRIGKKAADGMDVRQLEPRPGREDFLIIDIAEIA